MSEARKLGDFSTFTWRRQEKWRTETTKTSQKMQMNVCKEMITQICHFSSNIITVNFIFILFLYSYYFFFFFFIFCFVFFVFSWTHFNLAVLFDVCYGCPNREDGATAPKGPDPDPFFFLAKISVIFFSFCFDGEGPRRGGRRCLTQIKLLLLIFEWLQEGEA